MKIIKKWVSVLFSMVLMMTTVLSTSIYANETEPTTSNSLLQISVVGNGQVNLTGVDEEQTLSNGDNYSIELPVGTKVTLSASTDGIIDNITKNDTTIAGFESGKTSLSFEYVTDNQQADFIFSFKEQIKEEKATEEITVAEPVTKNQDTIETPAVEESNVKEEDAEETSEIHDEIDRTKLREDGIMIDFSVTENTEQTLKMLADYADDITDAKGYRQARKAKAEETGLAKYCDKDYFLTSAYFKKYDVNMLQYDNCLILNPYSVKSVYEKQKKALDTNVSKKSKNQDKAPLSETLSVIDQATYTFTNPEQGGTIFNGLWRLSNQHLSFCANGMAAPPVVGDAGSVQVADNANLRKALYYGYGGPEDILTPRYGQDNAIVITDDMVSNAYSGTSIGKVFSNGFHWQFLEKLWNEITSKPDPKGFIAYIVPIPGQGQNWQGQWVNKQTLTYGVYAPTGELQISKESANPDITNGNPCYSLQGAQYGVYTSQANANSDKDRVGTLTIGSDGWSNTLSGINQGTYYLKELKAPQGYALDYNVYPIEVKAGEKATKTMMDFPQNDPITILLGKVDKDTNQNKPQGSASLADAQFTVKYYKGLYDVDPASQGQSPARTWIFKTDKDGFIDLTNEYKVSGDDFYYDSDGIITMPIGTLTIQETKAPNGYYINSEVFIRKITSSGSAEDVNTYNMPIVPEQVIKFRVSKIQETTATPIPGAKFRHTKPNGQTEELTTGDNGVIEITGLETGRHKLEEIYAPDGYEINTTVVEFEVASGGAISIVTNLDGTGVSTVKESDGNTLLTVADKVSPYDFKIKKINDHDKPLDGAEFTVYSDKECTQEVTKGVTQNGELIFEDLKDRTHYWFKETKAPKGYRIPVDITTAEVHVYELYTEATPAKGIFNFWIDGKQYDQTDTDVNAPIHVEGSQDNRVISVEIVNYVGLKLPTTGSSGTSLLMLLGMMFMGVGAAMIYSKRKKCKE